MPINITLDLLKGMNNSVINQKAPEQKKLKKFFKKVIERSGEHRWAAARKAESDVNRRDAFRLFEYLVGQEPGLGFETDAHYNHAHGYLSKAISVLEQAAVVQPNAEENKIQAEKVSMAQEFLKNLTIFSDSEKQSWMHVRLALLAIIDTNHPVYKKSQADAEQKAEVDAKTAAAQKQHAEEQRYKAQSDQVESLRQQLSLMTNLFGTLAQQNPQALTNLQTAFMQQQAQNTPGPAQQPAVSATTAVQQPAVVTQPAPQPAVQTQVQAPVSITQGRPWC